MIKKSLIRKMRNMAIVFLACLGALSMWGFSSAHALQPTLEGKSDTCRWQYARLSGKEAGEEAYVLRVSPLEGLDYGTLKSWGPHTPPWRSREADSYRKKTIRIEIKANGSRRPVKLLTCRGMFYGFSKVKTADLSGLDTTLAQDMNKMFYKCEKLTSISGLDGFNTVRVSDMREMFSHCYALRFLEVETWETDIVTRMDQLFFKCHALKMLDLSEWNVSCVTSMERMFAHCHSLTTIGDTGRWKVARVATMFEMFHGCSSLVKLDMSGWVVPDGVMTRGMFHKTLHLKSIRIGRCVRIKNSTEFSSAGSKVGPDTCWVQVADGTANSPRGRVFSSSDALRSFHNDTRTRSTGSFQHYVKLKICRGTSGDCVWEYLPRGRKDSRGKETYLLRIHPSPGRDSGTLGRWRKTPPWRDHEEFCAQTTKVEIKNGINVQTPVKARTCLNMFSFFTKLRKIDVSGLDVKNVTDMRKMFRGCRALTSLDLSAWKVSNGVRMKKMFEQTWFLKTIRLGESFRIKDDAMFDDAGSRLDTHWAQVATGSVKNPAGRIFISAGYLADFHHDRTKRKTDIEQYTRVTPSFVVIFDKGACDVVGSMEPQSFAFCEGKALNKNVYKRAGHKFAGWKDDNGYIYRDGQFFKNTMSESESNTQKVLSAEWIPISYTVAFSANVPATGTSIAVPDNLVVKYGQDARIPADALDRKGYRFLWWSTKPDDTGERYHPDAEIKNVTSNIVLYAQWLEITMTAYEISEQTSQEKDLELSTPPVAQAPELTDSEPEPTDPEPEPTDQELESPSQTWESASQTWESPSQTWESPSQTWESPSQTWESPSQTWESPSQTWESASPAQEPQSPIEDPESPAQEPQSPIEDPESPAQEPQSPIEDPESPAQEPRPIPRKRSYVSSRYKRDGSSRKCMSMREGQ